jgi:hypothetical protein
MNAFLGAKQSTFKRTPSVLSYSSPSHILRGRTAHNNNNSSLKEISQTVSAAQLEAHLKDYLYKTMQVDLETSSLKKPSSEYKFPIKPMVSNLKQGPKTMNGS